MYVCVFLKRLEQRRLNTGSLNIQRAKNKILLICNLLYSAKLSFSGGGGGMVVYEGGGGEGLDNKLIVATK